MEYAAAFALALSGDSSGSQRLAEDLAKRFPEATPVQFEYLPRLRTLFALYHKAPSEAIERLQTALPYDLAMPGMAFLAKFGGLYLAYVRGQAYLEAARGREAASEFQKVLDHRGIVLADPIGAVAHLHLGRAFALAVDVMRLCSLTLVLVGVACVPLWAEDFTGKVVGISDGDTIRVMHNGRAERIRLWGIDAPETGQAFGSRARQFTGDLAFHKTVTVRVRDTDQYGRTVAEIILPDGRNLNYEIVRAGFAWWYRQYARRDSTLATLEQEARDAKRGLWADPRPVPPWEFRRQKRTRSPAH